MITTTLQPSFLIADDHGIVRNGLAVMINQNFENPTVFEAGNFQDIMALFENNKIDLLILDINFPDGNALKILPVVKIMQPNVKVLMFSSFDEEIYALRYIKAGADGYLSKLSPPDEIERALESIIKTGKYTSEKIKDKLMDSFLQNKSANPLENLSAREMEIATLFVKGYGNLEISNELNLKATTISTYKGRVFEKLNVNNLPDLIQIFNLHNENY
jgi:DNA-binding NarL/FixJ family response regulator